jgi:hypothetical protein
MKWLSMVDGFASADDRRYVRLSVDGWREAVIWMSCEALFLNDEGGL